jgi:hypothetical protein
MARDASNSPAVNRDECAIHMNKHHFYNIFWQFIVFVFVFYFAFTTFLHSDDIGRTKDGIGPRPAETQRTPHQTSATNCPSGVDANWRLGSNSFASAS